MQDYFGYLADPGKGLGCSSNTRVITRLIQWVTLFLQLTLQRTHAQTIWDGASSQKINYVTQIWDILNIKGY